MNTSRPHRAVAARRRGSFQPLLPVLCLALLAPRAGEAARGNDLGSGYEWFDTADGATAGPGFFDLGAVTVSPADDAPPFMITLPWAFPFYGGSFTEAWISDNGWIGFTDPAGMAYPTPDGLPSGAAPFNAIAPFWSGLVLANPAAGQYVRHGTVNAFNAYRIQFSGVESASGQLIAIDLYLYRDGRIKFHYLIGPSTARATVGIQNGDGSDGFSVVDVGTPAPGVPSTPATGYAVDVLPPPLLVGECALVPDLPCGPRSDSLPGALPQNIITYGCSAQAHAARERIYRITLAEASRLVVTLTAGTARNLRMYLLEACSERRCLFGPGTTIDRLMGAGTYYLVVDAPATTDEGTFNLQVDCTPLGEPLACGATVSGDTTGGSAYFGTYPCAGATNLSGPEDAYLIDVASSTNLRATLTAASADLDVVLLSLPAGEPVTSADCVAHGDASLVYWGAAPGTYLLVVDGRAGAAGTYTLETECVVAADCSAPAGVVDFRTGRRQDVTGDTTGAPANVDVYQCAPGDVFGGSELVYELDLPTAGQVGVFEPGTTSGLSFFILDACNEGSCVGGVGSCGAELPAGTHYLVVDSPAGAEGPFFAELVFEAFFHRWSECEDPDGGTALSDTVNTVWELDDGAYCYTNTASRNFPDGCDFAMYVAPRCGTEFHIPLYDVESGHVRVFDIFADRYLELNAVSTGGFRQTSDDISWQDCAGTDGQWNNQTTDIWFERPEGLCGVYRIEFPLHAGFIWDLYANCTGQNVEGFPIYDSLCAALAAFDPLPNVSLLSADAVVTCPDIDVTYTLINTGCAPAVDVVVTLFDGGTPVATDTVALVEPGATVTQSFAASFPGGMSTSNVTVEVDAGDAVQECEETPGAGCGVAVGVDVRQVVDCGPDCDIFPVGRALPAGTCLGGTVDVDGGSSTHSGCTSGILEYQLTGPLGTIPWQASPVFRGLAPTETTDYRLDVRCSDPGLSTTCVGAVTVRVPVDRAPVFDASSIRVTENDCELGILLEWDRATFLGPTGAGVYNLYRSTVSCADAVDPSSPTGGLVATEVSRNFTDLMTEPGQTYYYVVEAEDETHFPDGCLPPGPAFGGATTRADVPGGACTGVTERFGTPADLLPRVGPTLRVGMPDAYSASTVPLRWGTDRPIDVGADEHYHVFRFPGLAAPGAQLNVPDPPLLQAARFTDTTADAPGVPVLYYLLFVADVCHLDNRDFDRFTTPFP